MKTDCYFVWSVSATVETGDRYRRKETHDVAAHSFEKAQEIFKSVYPESKCFEFEFVTKTPRFIWCEISPADV